MRGTQTIRHRARVRAKPAGTTVNAPVQADQITIPGVDIEVSREQAAIGAVIILVLLALLARGGGSRQGFVISRA